MRKLAWHRDLVRVARAALHVAWGKCPETISTRALALKSNLNARAHACVRRCARSWETSPNHLRHLFLGPSATISGRPSAPKPKVDPAVPMGGRGNNWSSSSVEGPEVTTSGGLSRAHLPRATPGLDDRCFDAHPLVIRSEMWDHARRRLAEAAGYRHSDSPRRRMCAQP